MSFFEESSKKPQNPQRSQTLRRDENKNYQIEDETLSMLKRLRFYEAKPQKNSNFWMRLRLAFSRFLPTLIGY